LYTKTFYKLNYPIFESMEFKVGRKIRRLRQEMNLSQENIADLTGFSQHKISDIENDRANLKLEDLPLFAKIFKVEPETILQSEDISFTNTNNTIEQQNQAYNIHLNNVEITNQLLATQNELLKKLIVLFENKAS
jgi:transcriptional regulator with XRE-family HTH domain